MASPEHSRPHSFMDTGSRFRWGTVADSIQPRDGASRGFCRPHYFRQPRLQASHTGLDGGSAWRRSRISDDQRPQERLADRDCSERAGDQLRVDPQRYESSQKIHNDTAQRERRSDRPRPASGASTEADVDQEAPEHKPRERRQRQHHSFPDSDDRRCDRGNSGEKEGVERPRHEPFEH